jgi:hypothetical protein
MATSPSLVFFTNKPDGRWHGKKGKKDAQYVHVGEEHQHGRELGGLKTRRHRLRHFEMHPKTLSCPLKLPFVQQFMKPVNSAYFG